MVKIDSSKGLVLSALGLALRHRLSIYDAMIVQAAIDSGSTTLYSEDLHDGQRFGDLRVVDPFTHPPVAASEPVATYKAPRRGSSPRGGALRI